jgi:hypothetical protein
VQYGPDSTRVKSITVRPDSDPGIPAFYWPARTTGHSTLQPHVAADAEGRLTISPMAIVVFTGHA